VTAKEYREYIAKQNTPTKYRNKKTLVDGHVFDSKLEADRYVELTLLQRSGQIQGFGIQPSFVLPGGIRYRPDFIVCGADELIWVEDSKGKETDLFKNKQKLWREAYPWLELKIVK